MAKENNNSIKEINPFLFRYPPNNRFINGAWKNQVEEPIIKDDFGESITDKESYRLSLASKRGAIGNGSSQSGWYMFPDGNYDPNKDFSYIMRQDLSVVDIDRYIEQLQIKLESSDESLKAEIQEQLDAATAYKENNAKQSSSDDNGSSGAE